MFTDRQLSRGSAATLVAPAPVRRAEATAPALPSRAGDLRRLASARLAAWDLAEDDRDAALLVAGELLANAVQHGRSTMTLTLALHPQLLHICVADHGPAAVTARPTPDADEHGRGLAIVTALAAWVEVVHDDTGHRVWAALGLGARL